MKTTSLERDDLSTGVRVSTVRCENECGRVWYETLAYVPEPWYCGEEPWCADTEVEARQNHATRIRRALDT